MANFGHASPTMLPRPSLSSTVPSLHDGLPLHCRVYHPSSLAAAPDSPSWQRHCAVVAHPYAPLGGSYDDFVVNLVANTLLRQGFLVTTFNFRGAHGSAGRTSWTAKAERADYMSVVGFVSHYVHFLNPFEQQLPSQLEKVGPVEQAEDGPASTLAVQIRPPTPTSPGPLPVGGSNPIMLLAGYSYGAMITTRLPYLETILAVFATPESGSPAAEIRLRAQHLAETQNTIIASARAAAVDHLGPKSPRKGIGLRVGGDEENRKSHDSRRSFSAELEETVRHGVAELLAKTRKGHRRSQSGQSRPSRDVDRPAEVSEQSLEHLPSLPGRTEFRSAYLLVSPLQGIITNLATMSLPSKLSGITTRLWDRSPGGNAKETSHPAPTGSAALSQPNSAEAEAKLIQNTTLAIYGDCDGFVPVRKLREWASRLERTQESQFRAHEVSSANHFWTEINVARTLQDAVRTFAQSLIDETDMVK